uniref:Uncharacterized protein n=1 Tax=Stegastes partitus TaxID=144197 RepID=A0A3B5ABI6_9TELE
MHPTKKTPKAQSRKYVVQGRTPQMKLMLSKNIAVCLTFARDHQNGPNYFSTLLFTIGTSNYSY